MFFKIFCLLHPATVIQFLKFLRYDCMPIRLDEVLLFRLYFRCVGFPLSLKPVATTLIELQRQICDTVRRRF